MKKLLVLVFSFTLLSLVFAESVGTIDTQEILQKYKGAAQMQKELVTKKNDLDKALNVERQKLTDMKTALDKKGSKASKSDQDAFTTLEKKYQDDFSQMQQELNTYQMQQMQGLKNRISTAVQTVAKQGKYDLVVDAQAVWYGGTDVTAKVLDVLNSMKSIDLN